MHYSGKPFKRIIVVKVFYRFLAFRFCVDLKQMQFYSNNKKNVNGIYVQMYCIKSFNNSFCLFVSIAKISQFFNSILIALYSGFTLFYHLFQECIISVIKIRYEYQFYEKTKMNFFRISICSYSTSCNCYFSFLYQHDVHL